MKHAILLAPFLFFAAVGSGSGADDLALRITFDGTKAAVLTHRGEQWKLQADGLGLSLTKAADGTVTLRRGETSVASGRRSGSELLLQATEGRFLKLELKADKTQVWLTSQGEPFEFKAKSDEVKVRQGKTELGKVKFYPDTGKLKAKNAAEEEVALVRGSTKATAALGAFLLPGEIPLEQKLLVFLLLVAVDR